MRATVYMMAKAPVAGATKTRLATAMTPEIAARLYRAFVLDTWDALGDVANVERILAYVGDVAAFPARLRRGHTVEQPTGDLGAKMAALAAAGLGRGAPVVIVGSDLPGLPPMYVDAIIDSVASADVVIGPSSDGGFYAVGFSRDPEGALAGIPWSTTKTFARTVDALRARGFRVAFAPAFDDVDDIAALASLRNRIDSGDVRAPATAAQLSIVEGEVWR